LQDVRILREEAKKLFDQLEVYDGRLERLQHDELLPQLGEAGQADITAKCTLIRQLLDNITINVAPVRAPEQLRDYNKALSVLDSMRQELGAAGAAADVATVQHCAEQITLNANACEPEPVGPINYKYQGAVLGCTKDDQKQLRKQWRALKEQAQRAVARAQEEAAASGGAAAAPVPPVRAPKQPSPIPVEEGSEHGTPVSGGGSTPHSSAPTPTPAAGVGQEPPRYAPGVGGARSHHEQQQQQQPPGVQSARPARRGDRSGPFRTMFGGGGLPYGGGFEAQDPQEEYRQEQERRMRQEQYRRQQYEQQQARARAQAQARARQQRMGGLFDDGWGNAFGGSFW